MITRLGEIVWRVTEADIEVWYVPETHQARFFQITSGGSNVARLEWIGDGSFRAGKLSAFAPLPIHPKAVRMVESQLSGWIEWYAEREAARAAGEGKP